MFSAGILKLPASTAPLSMARARCWLGRTPSAPAGRLSISAGKARPIVRTPPAPAEPHPRSRSDLRRETSGARRSAAGHPLQSQRPQGFGADLGVGRERELLLGEEQDAAGHLVGGDSTPEEG